MNRIRENYFYNVLINVLNTLLPILSFPYISRVLMPEGIGKAQFLLSVAQYFVVLAVLGIPVYGVREIAKVRAQPQLLSRVFWEIFIINVLSAALVSCFYLGVILTYRPFAGEVSSFMLVGTLVFFSFMNIDWLYSGLEMFKQISLRSMCVKLISLIALFLFVKDKEDMVLYLLIVVFSFLGNQVWNFFILRKYISFSPVGLHPLQHIKPILLNFGVLFAISIYTVFDTILLGLLSSDREVGYYTAAVKVSKVVIPVVTALGVVLLPRLSVAMNQDNRAEVQHLANQSFWYVGTLAVPIAVGLFAFADEFVLLFSGPAYVNAILPMKLMSPLVLVIGLAHIFAFQLLIPAKKEKWYLLAVTIGGVCCVVLNIMLVPRFYSVGAAFANLTTEVLITVLSFLFVRRFFSIDLNWRKFFLKIGYVSVLFVLVANFLRWMDLSSLVVLSLGIPVCAASYFFVLIFVEKDRHLVSEFMILYQKLTKYKIRI